MSSVINVKVTIKIKGMRKIIIEQFIRKYGTVFGSSSQQRFPTEPCKSIASRCTRRKTKDNTCGYIMKNLQFCQLEKRSPDRPR